MEDSVRERLKAIYYEPKPVKILDTFIEQFGEDCVDSTILTFDQFIDAIKDLTPGRLGITRFSDSNQYGSYTMDAADYEKNGRGKPLIDYVPDLGMLDYLKPKFHSAILNGNTTFAITIHFPKVRVSNEYDKFIDIQDLYARVQCNIDGRMTEGVKMTRTTFPYSHFKAHYAHSHLPTVYSNDIGNWRYPCLGNGPLNETQYTLSRSYDINIWGLFTYELAKYVTVESISGGPYVRLESVGKGDIASDLCFYKLDNTFPICRHRGLNKLIMHFIKYYASKHKFKVKFVDGEYQFGENPVDACIHMSNEFIQWFNKYGITSPLTAEFVKTELMRPYIVADGKIYWKHENDGVSVDDARRVDGRQLFTFKGNPVRLRILLSDELLNNDNTYLLFTSTVLNRIVSYILGLVNLKQSKRNGSKRQNSQGEQGEQEETDLSEKCLIV